MDVFPEPFLPPSNHSSFQEMCKHARVGQERGSYEMEIKQKMTKQPNFLPLPSAQSMASTGVPAMLSLAPS